ncbi:TLC domain containing protein [Nitzschia inconspicua]|uniref:TLC domain containing protein n=1 Tax=Nitzschia inconspicua TaxID=303405 RepID=A0A9K3PG85_9STRA|nr:TLC domain containing protein [Nitzschia inconspicua]
MPEVGVSLALRRHRSLIGSKGEVRGNLSKPNNHANGSNGSLNQLTEERQSSPRHLQSPARSRRRPVNGRSSTCSPPRNTTTITTRKNGSRRSRRPSSSSSWQLFLEMSALYGFCMILPSILRSMIRFYLFCWEPGGILYQLFGNICTLSWPSRFEWCYQYLTESYGINGDSMSSSSVLAPDAGLSDVAIVILFSLTMAVVRVVLVHFLVPNYKQPKRLEALVKCKSIHLLSSQYPGSITPRSSLSYKRQLHSNLTNDPAMILPGLDMPNLHADVNSLGGDHDDDDGDSSETAPGAVVEVHMLPRHPASPLFHTPRDTLMGPDPLRHTTDDKSTQPATWALGKKEERQPLRDDSDSQHGWGLYDDVDDGDDQEDENPAPAVSSGLLTNLSAQNLQALLEQAAPSRGNLSRNSSFRSVKENDHRVFAAPKYATAVFRLLFCIFSCLVGLFFFGRADFWPPAVGGSGNTKNCWDLGSVGATVMDSDFDQRNSVLRRYYLLQASYHFHSAAFHVLTSLLLWFVSKQSKNKDASMSSPFFLGLIPMGMFTLYNLKTFFQHCFSIVLIMVTYLFSSTRRLGAIAMFSFDASSLFLHLLQMGINAPRKHQDQDSQQPKPLPSSIFLLHRLVVIPAFCYARFYVFPFVIAFSALEESQDWLRQLENMLIPGTAQYIHGFFVVAFLLFLAMNIVYFLRLLNLPHVMATASNPPPQITTEEERRLQGSR